MTTIEVGYGPLQRIDGPPPEAPLYGLLQAADAPAGGVRFVTDTDANGNERWGNGVEVYPYPTAEATGTFNQFAPGSEATTKGFGDDAPDTPQFGALTIYLAETCSALRVSQWIEEFKARATLALTAMEGALVAEEFLTGNRLPNNPFLSDGNGVFPNASSVTSPINALALLEKEIAVSKKRGLIHMSPQMATTLRERFALDNKTGVLRTINGTVIIPDFGYAEGATPLGHAAPGATSEWMYATGPVDVRRSEVFVVPDDVSEALDRGTPGGATNGRPNSITYRAERYYLVDWDTVVQAAVLADRCQTTC